MIDSADIAAPLTDSAVRRKVFPEGTVPAGEGAGWYAIRAFKGKVFKIKEDFDRAGWKTYMAMRSEETVVNGHRVSRDVQIVPQLLFVRCPRKWLEEYKGVEFGYGEYFMIYRRKVVNDSGFTENVPAVIPESQMAAFMFITSAGDGRDISYYGEKMPEFSEGQRVRVVEGIYKGAEGIVKRIKRDRKLLVAIEGVAVVAISRIPMSWLEKVEG